ncbi:MAG: type II toxin-antitoxin system HicB family antitoxin [Armatimonadota bacterium]|nr:type II toxin-antitoxin system HicB family antitoxin [Armatimonadota bacterium]
MSKKRKITFLPLVIERSGDGFLVRCPLIQGAFAEGDTIAEAIFNCLDVISMIAAYRKEIREIGVSVQEFMDIV